MTTRASAKAAGSKWERVCAELLRLLPSFAAAERAPRWGAEDKGDLLNTGDFTIECKATKSIDLAGFVDEAFVENLHSGRRWGVVFIKRRRKPSAEGYAVMRIEDWAELADFYHFYKAEHDAEVERRAAAESEYLKQYESK